jgi:sporulation-control protein
MEGKIMMLRKYMSLLGIGSAKVDLIIDENVYRPGELVNGYFLLKGGTIEQKIKRIESDLVQINKLLDTEKVIGSTTILTSQQIDSEEQSKTPFTFLLPESLEDTTAEVSYRFKTRLIFNEGVKSLDQDHITISNQN